MHETGVAIFQRSFNWQIHFVVLPDLVSGGAVALLRCESAHLAYVNWVERHHRNRTLHQFDDGREQTGTVANYTSVFDAVFCFQFCRTGEREKFRPDFLSKPVRNYLCAGSLRRFRWPGLDSEKTLSLSQNNHSTPAVASPAKWRKPKIWPRRCRNSALLRWRGRSSETSIMRSILPGRAVIITMRSLM